MEIDEVQAGYESARPKYEQLKGEIIYILESALAQRGIAIHMLEGRIKPVDSLIAKMERQETEPPFEEIVDICGIRIIGLFLSDIQEIGKLLEETFELESTDDKITAKPHEEFGGFRWIHLSKIRDPIPVAPPTTDMGINRDDLSALDIQRYEHRTRLTVRLPVIVTPAPPERAAIPTAADTVSNLVAQPEGARSNGTHSGRYGLPGHSEWTHRADRDHEERTM